VKVKGSQPRFELHNFTDFISVMQTAKNVQLYIWNVKL